MPIKEYESRFWQYLRQLKTLFDHICSSNDFLIKCIFQTKSLNKLERSFRVNNIPFNNFNSLCYYNDICMDINVALLSYIFILLTDLIELNLYGTQWGKFNEGHDNFQQYEYIACVKSVLVLLLSHYRTWHVLYLSRHITGI